MADIDVSKYDHSPIHKAVILKDYSALSKIIVDLPQLIDSSKIQAESVSLAEEAKADSISLVIDRRDDVPNRDTLLHLAVKFGDEISTQILMLAGADYSLHNEGGWSALAEAICNRKEGIAKIILKHRQPLSCAKVCRRWPRLIATMRRMRDFHTEITFHFESSIIPFVSRVAPSGNFKIWKRGANLRADMTFTGMDGRVDQSVLLLGDGSEDGKVSPGSLCIFCHKDKEVMMGYTDGSGATASEAAVQAEVTAMSQTNVCSLEIDLTGVVLIPQMTWLRNENTEMVGSCKSIAYDMHNVITCTKSRKVPGAMTNEGLFNSCREKEMKSRFDDVLTKEEREQHENALEVDSLDENGETKQENKGWFSGWLRREHTHTESGSGENECKKGLMPVLWLSPDFQLQTKELLPLLDIFGNEVKAIQGLRELLATKLPNGTFPVKVEIPVFPTIRLVGTFQNFEELQPADEFSTPPSSPNAGESPSSVETSTSWFQWIKSPYQQYTDSSRTTSIHEPFVIPCDYTWTTIEEKKKKMQEK